MISNKLNNTISCNFCNLPANHKNNIIINRRNRLLRTNKMTTEKILKPRNLEVTGLIYSHKEFLADAMGLRDYERRKTQSAPASFSRESNSQDNDNNDDILAIKNTYAQKRVRPTLLPLQMKNKNSKKKNNMKCKNNVTTKTTTNTKKWNLVTKSSSLSNLIYPVKHANISITNGFNHNKPLQKGRNKLYEAIGLDRIHRAKSQERIVLKESISLQHHDEQKENVKKDSNSSNEDLMPKTSPMSCNSPYPDDEGPTPQYLTRGRTDSNVSVRDTRFTPSFANMPKYPMSSPDNDEVFNWNGENVMLAPSISSTDLHERRSNKLKFSSCNDNDNDEDDENELSGTIQLRNSYVSKFNLKLPTFVNKISQTNDVIEVSPREEEGEEELRERDNKEEDHLMKKKYKKYKIAAKIVAYTPPLHDDMLKREQKHANNGHVLSQLRLLQLATMNNDDNKKM